MSEKKDKCEILVHKKPQKKYNIELDTEQFRNPSGNWEEQYFSDEKICVYGCSLGGYKYLCFPVSPLKIYLVDKETNEAFLVPYDLYIPTEWLDNRFIITRPIDLTEHSIYFQYWLTNLRNVVVNDSYEENDFTIPKDTDKTVVIPFPTYNFKFFFAHTGVTNWGIDICQFISNCDNIYKIEHGVDLTNVIINNLYGLDKVEKTDAGAEKTDPKLAFPSWYTTIEINAFGSTADMTNCHLRLWSRY